jgi:tetratricopeptide (TPR) repeat protein
MPLEYPTAALPPTEDSAARALDAYLAAVEAGTAPPREQFLEHHPQLADDLDACLAALRFIGRAAEAPRALAAGAAAEPLPEAPPGQLGDYRLVREVGRGGMGVVYEAEQVSLGRRVALKVLPFAATLDPRQLQRFQNEARAAAALDHPHIVHVHAVGCERAVHFYAMQFIDGQTLAALIADRRRAAGRPPAPADQPTAPQLPEAAGPAPDTAPRAALSTERGPLDSAYFRRVAELGIQAAEALDHAHQLGVVHRDVKPANLLVDGRGSLWVTDFGLAHVQSDARLTMTGDLLGTLRYMSPEQALAQRVVVDHRTDVYSLGATLYELLTLEPAFSGGDRKELLRQIAFEEPRPARRWHKGIPAELETIVQKAMEKNPADRYATARELADDLGRYLADEPIRARPPGRVRRLRKWGRRHPALVAGAATLLLAVLFLGGAVLWRELAQRAAAADAVEAALEQAENLRDQERWDEALAVLDGAQGRLEGRALGGLGQRVQQAWRDVQVLKQLEEAGVQLAIGSNDFGYDREGANRLYAKAFATYGLEVFAPNQKEVAEAIRASAIGNRLGMALAQWAHVRDRLHRGQGRPLWSLADMVDDNAWRRRLRTAAQLRDRASLEKLAKDKKLLSQPPAALVLLAQDLYLAGKSSHAERFLRRAQASRPADFWLNFELANALGSKESTAVAERIRFYQAALALRPTSPGVHLSLGNALKDKGDLDGAIACYREALRLKPDYAVAHNNLGVALGHKGRTEAAIACYREALRLKPDEAEAHNNLGGALQAKGRTEEAIGWYRKALRLKPDYAEAHINLGGALRIKGDLDGSITECQEALRLKPDEAEAHNALGAALYVKGRTDEAIACFQKALCLEPDNAWAHNNLGAALRVKGRTEEAIACFRKAVRLKPDNAEAHRHLGQVLAAKGDIEGAMAAFRAALRLNNDMPDVHNNLGAVLANQGRLKEAAAEFREALRLQPDHALAHYSLGMYLRERGRLAEALGHLRRGHQLGASDPGWFYHRSAEEVKECERLVALDRQWPAILRGQVQPADAAERADYARLYRVKRHYAAAARVFRQALAAQPDRVATAVNNLRYEAACAAALAGCGHGDDAASLTAAQRAELRGQALAWLRANLAAWRTLLAREPANIRPALTQWLRNWLADPDFNGVRGPDALAKLPAAEKQAWQQLWADVTETLRRTTDKPPARPDASKS